MQQSKSETSELLVTQGRLFEAMLQTGHAFCLTGPVVEGNRIGRTLGYPTANLKLPDPDGLLPGKGVYTAMVLYDGQLYDAMVNVGIRPTLDMHHVTIEAHLFCFNKDIYGEQIGIFFLERIRDEMRFSSLSELSMQLAEDRKNSLEKLKMIRNNLKLKEGRLEYLREKPTSPA